jgi:FixJ family two-component response regulator
MNTKRILLNNCKGHIFLIEDDANLSASLVSSLEYIGYQVHPFLNAADFLNLDLSKYSPAVIVSDVSLPGFSGVELQTKLIDLGSLIPIIFISGECSVSESILGMKQGAIEFLTKPFRRDDLINAITWGIELDKNRLKKIELKSSSSRLLNALAPREREVFDLLAGGISNHEVSIRLGLSSETVKQYKKQIKQKLKMNSLSEFIELSKNAK